MRRLLLLVTLSIICIAVAFASLEEARGQHSATLDFKVSLPDSMVFGFSSEPVDSWADEPEKISDSFDIDPDNPAPIYVYWKIASSSPLNISLSGEAMKSMEDRVIDWNAGWEYQGEKTVLGYSDDYASKPVVAMGTGFKSTVGSERIDISLESLEAIPGYYKGTITLEVNNI